MTDPAPNPRPPRAWSWIIAIVLIEAIGVGGYLAYTTIMTPERTVEKTADRLEGMAGKVWQHLEGALRPNVTLKTVIHGQFARIETTPKLVVMTDTINVEVVRSSEKRALWGLLNLGTTEVRLRAPGNKIQFVVPLGKVTADDFSYDAAARKVTVRVPAPVLDTDLVEVQSDPAKIEVQTSVGWARLSAYSGKSLEEKSRAALRQEVLAAADTPAMHDLARVQAEKALRGFFGDLAAALADGVRMEFEFKPASGGRR